MTTATKTTRLTLVVPEDFRRNLKEQARKHGKSPSAYVIERLAFNKTDTDADYDLEDVNVAIARGLYEVEQARKNGQRLPHIDTLIPRRR